MFGDNLAALLVAHNVGDHLAQTDHQAAAKTTSWRAMVGHVGGYTAVAAVALAALPERPSFGRAVLGLAFSAGTHALIDRRWPVRALLRATGSPGFAELATPLNGMYLADQALHHGCLYIAARLMTK
jgi:hypothetical protein